MATTTCLIGARGLCFQASDWKKYSECLSLNQEEALRELKRFGSKVDVPQHVAVVSGVEPASDAAQRGHFKMENDVKEGFKGHDAVLQTRSEFYQWFSDLEATRASEAEATYKGHAQKIEKHIELCNDMLELVDDVLETFTALKESQRTISDRTDALKDQCDLLVSERDKLSKVSHVVNERLEHFNRLESLSSLFHAPVQATSNPEEIVKGLEELDMSLSFTSKHPEYLESSKYKAKFQNLQIRAISLVKSYFQESISVAAAECKDAAKAVEDGEDTSEEGSSIAAMTLQNVKFRAIAEPRVKELMAGIIKHMDRPSYQQLVQDCTAIYCRARFELIRYNMLTEIQAPTQDRGVMDILRHSSEVISRGAEIELQLYQQIFAGVKSSQAAQFLSPLFDSMCVLMSAIVEPSIYSSNFNDIETLCEINSYVDSLRQNRSLGAIFNVPSLSKLMQGVGQMIVKQARDDCSSAIAMFDRTPNSVSMVDDSVREFIKVAKPPLSLGECMSKRNGIVAFEPVSRTLGILQKVYGSVQNDVFVDLLRIVVPETFSIIHRGSEVCSEALGEAFGAVFSNLQLYEVSQCLDTFQVDFKSKEISNNNISQLGRRLTTKIPLLSSFSQKSTQSGLDIKAEVDKKLSVAHDFCILACSQDVMNPLLSFLTKVTAAKVTLEDSKDIKSRAFASVERVTEVSRSVGEAVRGPLLQNLVLLAIVMPEKERSTLTQAIQENTEDVHQQMEAILNEEYSSDERKSIDFVPKEHLLAVFPR